MLNTTIKLAHAPELIILERLLDFRPAVHREWTVADDGFYDGFAVHHKGFGVGHRFHDDAVKAYVDFAHLRLDELLQQALKMVF